FGKHAIRQTGGNLVRARMDWLLTLCVMAASVLAAKAFSRTRALSATILALKASVEVLDQRLSRLEDPPASVIEAPLPKETVGEPAEARPSNVSQALAAAGAATIFASLYAAYQLYGLVPPALAFPLLALTAVATVLMSLQHGPFVAVLALAGAFAVPAIVASE